MQTRPLGRTGLHVSRLGFGAMRLPMTRDGEHVDMDVAVDLIGSALDARINYIDSGYFYCKGESETAVGLAVRGRRENIILSTKLPLGEVKTKGDARRVLEEQLRRLGTDRIDVYHLHGLSLERFRDVAEPLGILDDLERARSEGLLRILAFSTHDTPENAATLIDTGHFGSILCQYNLLDQRYAGTLTAARAAGLGVVVMGPVGGGRLGTPNETLSGSVPGTHSTPALALRFVFANPDVDCIISGMSTIGQVRENAELASRGEPLTPAEVRAVEERVAQLKAMADLYCTGCEYCLPCPADVNIPICFEAMNSLRVFGQVEHAFTRYRAIGDPWLKGKPASACTGCGACEEKCPQNIPIRKQLLEVAASFETESIKPDPGVPQ